MMTANDDAKRPNVNENGAAITTASVLRSWIYKTRGYGINTSSVISVCIWTPKSKMIYIWTKMRNLSNYSNIHIYHINLSFLFNWTLEFF